MAGKVDGEISRIQQRIELGLRQPDGQSIRNDGSTKLDATSVLHRSFNPKLQLDGQDAGPEKAGAGSFEEALKEALDGRHRSQRSRRSHPRQPTRAVSQPEPAFGGSTVGYPTKYLMAISPNVSLGYNPAAGADLRSRGVKPGTDD